jgi:hypothetical protein
MTADSISYNHSTNRSIEKKATFLSIYYGVSNYLGDLGGNSGIGKGFLYDVNFKKRSSFVGFSISKVKKEAVGFRLGYTTGSIAGSDGDAFYTSETDPAYKRYKRNLDFKSKISEWSLLLEIYPLKFLHQTKKAACWSMQPYLIGGIGWFKFNPQGSYVDPITRGDTWVDLQPLSTEGQGMKEYPNQKPYKLTQLNLPYGLGIQYKTGTKTSISFEYIGRKLFTDYLDDVSTTYIDPSLFTTYFNPSDAATAASINNKSNLIDPTNPYQVGDKRGNAKKNDFYYSFNLKVSIQMNKKKIQSIKSMNLPAWQHYKYDNQERCY